MAKKPKAAPPKEPTHSLDFIRDVSEAVYRLKLEQPSGGGPGAVQRMIANDKDSGEKLRGRAGAYDASTRVYLDVLKINPGAKL